MSKKFCITNGVKNEYVENNVVNKNKGYFFTDRPYYKKNFKKKLPL